MNWPRISLVTPSYNQGRYIAWTVRSVIHQRYPNLDYVVMDGGSKDDTVAVMEQFRPFLSHFSSAPDKGQADALHRGFQRTDGEIMGYLNSDDVLAPGALGFVAAYFRTHPHVDAIYSHRVIVDSRNLVTGYWMVPRHSNYLMKRWDMIPQETCFWRRRLFDQLGNIDPTYRFAMDYDLFARFMEVGRFCAINRFLGAFRKHEEAKTSTIIDTVGREECARVWAARGLRHRWFHRVISTRFYNGIHRRGHLHALSGRVLPGALPGIGYDYDRVWGGLLNEARLPGLVAAHAS